ncbi:MAG: polysaccharide biosynthesis C-terminal domain-containing protein, partial [Clostridiales bacterium]|nr:polysaccharide biosynthesis C-terminal domain-containing protein [Clostridiales bacterium]
MVRDLTKGDPTKLILQFCIPLVIGNIFQQFYNMVDSIVVGKFVGKAALSAVGSVASLSFLVIGFVLGACSGFAIPIAQSFGAGDMKKLRKYLANIIYLSLITGAVVTALTMSLSKRLLILMNTPETIIHDSYVYITIIFGGILATMFYNILSAVIRAVGDSKTPLYFLIFSSTLNIILDLIFVIVFSWGVMGVAVATVIAQFVSGFL